MKDRKDTAASVDKAINHLPGASIDAADCGDVTKALEKERTKTLDDNPRDNKLDE